MKTKHKIALYLIISNSLILILFSGSVYFYLRNYSYSDFYKRLDTRVSLAAQYHFENNQDDTKSIKSIMENHLEKLSKEKEVIIEFNFSDNLSKIATQNNIPTDLLENISKKNSANHFINNKFYSGIKYHKDNKNYFIIVSAENYYATHHLKLLKNAIIAGILLIMLITILLSLYFSKHIFDPITNITKNVEKISTNNIHLRLEENYHDNDIGQLTNTFNNLLDRIETSFETQKNFISNASHEFGTPLTSIIGEADVALMKERTPLEYQETLKNILNQAERLNQISQSLLFLAQTGYRENKMNFEIIRVDELIWESKEIIDQLNPKNNIFVDLSLLPDNPLKLKVLGNKHLLTLAFVNILNNACKYSNNKQVNIKIASSDNEVIVVFNDLGIGIPKTEITKIYDPFFRASNTKNFDGYGIGLPLTRNIIKIHSGQLIVSSEENKGTIVQIKLPVAKFQAKKTQEKV